MAYTYSTFVAALAQEAVVTASNADFIAMLPTFIQNGELRILRDVDLLETVVTDTAAIVLANTRSIALPTTYGRFVTVAGVNAHVNGVRLNALTPAARGFMDALFPSETAPAATSTPRYFCRSSDSGLLIGPAFGSSVSTPSLEIVGTVRPASLSEVNPTTFISTMLPDLLLAATMIEVAGWQKNYGAQADDPRMAVSWEHVYKDRLAPVSVEEMKKRFASGNWSGR